METLHSGRLSIEQPLRLALKEIPMLDTVLSLYRVYRTHQG
jgi:hypothetical protein